MADNIFTIISYQQPFNVNVMCVNDQKSDKKEQHDQNVFFFSTLTLSVDLVGHLAGLDSRSCLWPFKCCVVLVTPTNFWVTTKTTNINITVCRVMIYLSTFDQCLANMLVKFAKSYVLGIQHAPCSNGIVAVKQPKP